MELFVPGTTVIKEKRKSFHSVLSFWSFTRWPQIHNGKLKTRLFFPCYGYGKPWLTAFLADHTSRRKQSFHVSRQKNCQMLGHENIGF